MTPLKTLMKLSVILVEDVTTKKVPLLYPIMHQRKQYCSDKNAVLQVLILTPICFVHYFSRVILLSFIFFPVVLRLRLSGGKRHFHQ